MSDILLIDQIISDMKRDLPMVFDELNGTTSNELRVLNTKWPGIAGKTPFIDDIKTNFRFGVSAEIGIALMDQAAASASLSLVFNKDFYFTDVVSAIVEQASVFKAGALIVVSPKGLTMLQVEPTGSFKRNDNEVMLLEGEKCLSLAPVGTLNDYRVFCDPYAKDDELIMVLGQGWFQYSGSHILDVLPIVDAGDDGLDDSREIASDLKIETVSSLIRTIRVKSDAIKFG